MSKYCAKCNQIANDQDAFCSNCGSAEFYTVDEPSQVLNEQPAYEQVVYEQPVKKGFFKRIGVKLLCIILPILIAAGIVWMNIEPISAFFVKSFGSEEQYFEHTTETLAKDGIDDITKTYDEIVFGQREQAVNSTLSFYVSDEITKVVSGLAGNDAADIIDAGIDTINGTKLNLYVNNKGDRVETEIGVVLENEEFVKAYVMGDSKDGMAYVKLDGLNDKVLGIDLNEIYDMADMSIDFEQATELAEKLLPDAETLNKLINKYSDVALGGIKDVEKETEKVEIDGVEQKLTVLTVPFSEEQMVNVVLPVLEEAAEDKDLKEIIENAQNVLVENEIIDEDDLEEDAYDAFCDIIDEALEAVKDIDADDEVVFEIKLYVKGLNDVCGMALDVEDETMFSWISVEKGKDIATEISVPALSESIFGDKDTFVGIKGKGTKKGNIINAKYNVVVDKDAYATVTVTDYNQKQAENGYLNGKFRLEPTKELLNRIPEIDEISAIKSLDPYFEISLENNDKKSNAKIAVGSKDKDYVSISLNSEFSNAKKIADMKADYDIDEAEEWASEIDIEKLTKKLEKHQFISLLLQSSLQPTKKAYR